VEVVIVGEEVELEVVVGEVVLEVDVAFGVEVTIVRWGSLCGHDVASTLDTDGKSRLELGGKMDQWGKREGQGTVNVPCAATHFTSYLTGLPLRGPSILQSSTAIHNFPRSAHISR